VATIHGKERAIGPALMKALPITGYAVISGVDTDRFGAFSGEVQRTLSPLDACRAKARHGAEVSGLDLVIASEGSFGPYPPAPFIPCDEEFLVLFDAQEDAFLEHRHVSLLTVFGGEACTGWGQVKAFAERMKFPQHHLVLRPQERWATGDALYKGIAEEGELRARAEAMIATNGACWVETDMRALANPTRMAVIGETAERFAEELSRFCPSCGTCWFRVTGTRTGLPCEQCGWPTEVVRSYVRTCAACGYEAHEPRPDGRTTADPQHCGNCNP